jgi:P27 family predicted phage terminase small subunit
MGRKHVPGPLRKRGKPKSEPRPPKALPRCPSHLDDVARKEWRRLAKPLHDMGLLSTADRAAFAAYCQAWSRWVEAERKLKETPMLIRMPSGYIQQSPWLSISNKQLELMGRYMTELGLTPSSRTRLAVEAPAPGTGPTEIVLTWLEKDGTEKREPVRPRKRKTPETTTGEVIQYTVDPRIL